MESTTLRKSLDVGSGLRTQVRGMHIRFAPTRWCRIAGGHFGSFGKLNGISVALVARSGEMDNPDMTLPPMHERHEWLRFDTQGYTEEEQLDFETRLDEIEDGDLDMTKRLRMQHKGDDGEEAGLRVTASKAELVDYWTRISSGGDFMCLTPSYTLIREPLRRLCHKLIAFTVSSKGQESEKVTTTDLLFLRSIDEGMMGVTGGAAQVDPKVPQDAPTGREDVQDDPAPQQASQMSQVAALAPRTIA
ncbi:hypothetical protein Tco_0504668 [Tanacetum coccineum]